MGATLRKRQGNIMEMSGKETITRILGSRVSYVRLAFGSLRRPSNNMCFDTSSTGDRPGLPTCLLVLLLTAPCDPKITRRWECVKGTKTGTHAHGPN